MKRYAFTLLELVFVIVIMGILGKFGVEFLAQAYKSFIFTKINHQLQSNSSTAIAFISKRLEYRIKDSIIARIPNTRFDALADINNSNQDEYTVLEWVSTDIDGFRGDTTPYWSGINDITATGAGAGLIVSPQTNTTNMNTLVDILSNSNATVNDGALYFIGSNNDAQTGYGWDGNAINDQNRSMHPITTVGTTNVNHFIPDTTTPATNFTDIYEYYKYSWTANAIALEDYNTTTKTGNLYFYTNYQPWKGETYLDASKKNLLMQNVDTFQFMAIGSIVKIQVCVKSELIDGDSTGGYSICKEKTVY